MLKSQDCIVLIKLLPNLGVEMSQRQLAKILCISLAEINGIKRLEEAHKITGNGYSTKKQLRWHFNAQPARKVSSLLFSSNKVSQLSQSLFLPLYA